MKSILKIISATTAIAISTYALGDTYIACPTNISGTFINLQSTIHQGGYDWGFIQLPFSFFKTTQLALSEAQTTNQITADLPPTTTPMINCQGQTIIQNQPVLFLFTIFMPTTCPFHSSTNSYHVTPSADGKGWTCN